MSSHMWKSSLQNQEFQTPPWVRIVHASTAKTLKLEFSKSYNSEYIPCSRYAQSNGKAETASQALMLHYLAAEVHAWNVVFALLMNCKIRTTLPCFSMQAQWSKLQKRVKEQKVKQTSFCDRSAKSLQTFVRSDVARIDGPDAWGINVIVLQEVAWRSENVWDHTRP